METQLRAEDLERLAPCATRIAWAWPMKNSGLTVFWNTGFPHLGKTLPQLKEEPATSVLAPDAASLIHPSKPAVVVPKCELALPKCADAWVADSLLVLKPRIESSEDWRIRQFEDHVLGVNEDKSVDANRRRRGAALALNPAVRHVGMGIWSAPSTTSVKDKRLDKNKKLTSSYMVDMTLGTCSCPDYDRHKKKCKHIYAVEHVKNGNMYMGGEFTAGVLMKALNDTLNISVAPPRVPDFIQFEWREL